MGHPGLAGWALNIMILWEGSKKVKGSSRRCDDRSKRLEWCKARPLAKGWRWPLEAEKDGNGFASEASRKKKPPERNSRADDLTLASCCRPFVFLHNSLCWNLIPKPIVLGGGTFGMWLGYEGEACMNEVSALTKETRESSLNPFTMWRHSEKVAFCEPGRELLPDPKPNTGLSSLQNCENYISVVFKPTSLWYFVTATERG